RPECVLHQPRGLELLEAQLGVLPNGFADANDVGGAPVDSLEDARFELIAGHGESSSFPVLIARLTDPRGAATAAPSSPRSVSHPHGVPAVFANGNMFAGLVFGSMFLRLGEKGVEQFLGERVRMAGPCRR